MKTIIFTNSNPNQIALVNKIYNNIDIEAIVVSKNIIKKKKINKVSIYKKVLEALIGLPFRTSWNKIQKKYKNNFSTFPKIQLYEVNNINDELTETIIKEINPSLIIVSGTNLIKNNIINATNNKCLIMNLHTGISPYVKGGPNCTNWCLANSEFHLIGNTIMELDIGIDSGKIITTEQTILDGDESLFELHWKVMEHAHDLYIRAILYYMQNDNIKKIKQNDITKGNIYYTKNWTIKQKIKAFINYILFYKKSFKKSVLSTKIKTFSLKKGE